MATTIRTALTLLARLVLGLIFALSGISKIFGLASFRDSVAAYHILPTPLITPFAYALPFIELLLAIYLLLGLFQRAAAVVAAILLAIFTLAIAYSLLKGNTGHGCGCFSGSGGIASLPIVTWLAGGATITGFDLVRDLVFILLAIIIYVGNHDVLSLDRIFFGGDHDHFIDEDVA